MQADGANPGDGWHVTSGLADATLAGRFDLMAAPLVTNLATTNGKMHRLVVDVRLGNCRPIDGNWKGHWR